MSKNSTGKTSWLMTKAFYGVVISIVIAIAGVAIAIFNVSKTKDLIPFSSTSNEYTAPTSVYSTEKQVNIKITGIHDDRETAKTTESTTKNSLNRPYSGYFILPLNNKISKDFSDGAPVYSETMQDWRTHDGIDITANIGDNVISVQEGHVVDTYADDLWGEVVVIEHGGGMLAKYCGVKGTVETGTFVDQGQVIGTVVEIPVEAADGVHLHLETEVEGKSENPVKVLNLFQESTGLTD